ncbi:MAG: transcriptional activator RfaH [Alphaproteobacteria bacterium]|nr:transcriptional activator RfaH [Alphaproteobacteria bacterium]
MTWYVVQTQPNSERKAAFHLERQDITVYLPQYLKRWRHARKTDLRPTPLFPRYLFIAMDIAQARWRAVRSTIGVSALVCNGERPAAVPDGVVETIRAREDERGLVPLRMVNPYRKGDAVSVVEGGLAGASGFFECFDDQDRVILLLDMLGRKMRVTLPVASVAAAT